MIDATKLLSIKSTTICAFTFLMLLIFLFYYVLSFQLVTTSLSSNFAITIYFKAINKNLKPFRSCKFNF